jgi:etoposide-induced 2.4 mRNA
MSADNAGSTRFRPTSTQSAYPTFLSLPHTLALQLNWAWHGLIDSFRWDIVLRVAMTDAEVQANVIKSAMLNGLALASIYALDLVLAPLLKEQQHWFHRNIGWVYTLLWLFPVLIVSFWLNVCYPLLATE